MATATKICKVCGKEYPYCHSLRLDTNIFRWQDVACSPEHAATYFANIEASRSGANAKPEEPQEEQDQTEIEYDSFDEDESEDDFDDEFFEDDEDEDDEFLY